jgi:hypothetical protein
VTVSVGHCHAKVNEAIQTQMNRLQHTTTIYLNNQIAQYGKELAAKMPGNLKVRIDMKLCACVSLPSSHVCLVKIILSLRAAVLHNWVLDATHPRHALKSTCLTVHGSQGMARESQIHCVRHRGECPFRSVTS